MYSSGTITEGTSNSAQARLASHALPASMEVEPGGSASQVGGSSPAVKAWRDFHTDAGTSMRTRKALRMAMLSPRWASVSSVASAMVVAA